MTPPATLLRLNRRTLVNVLILGGTAETRVKVAHVFHRESPFRGGPFVWVNGLRDQQRLRSSLEAWVSATAPIPCPDPLRAAEGGTLFVDSVGSLSPAVQNLLLALTRPAPFGEPEDAWAGRLVVGDHHSLALAVAEGRFAAALYDVLDKVRVELDDPVRGAA